MFKLPKKSQSKPEIVERLLANGSITTSEAVVLLVEVHNQKIDVSTGGTLIMSKSEQPASEILKEVNTEKENKRTRILGGNINEY